MNLSVITPPAYEPVTLAEVYMHLRLDPSGDGTHPDDHMLGRHIADARQFVEVAARRALLLQTLRLSLPSFPVSCDFPYLPRTTVLRRIVLPRAPVVDVLAVYYYDAANALQTLSSSSYYLTDEQSPELRFVSEFAAPTVYDRPDAVRVHYRAGYPYTAQTQAGLAVNVPAGLKDAVLLGVQLLYDNLSPADRELTEKAREALIQPHRIQLSP